MTVALVCAALALLIAPKARHRLRFAAILHPARSVARFRPGRTYRLGAVAGCAGALALGSGPLVAAVLLAATVGIRTRRARHDKSYRAECGHLLDAMDAVIAELRVGAHPSPAAQAAAGESDGFAARAFAVSSARSRLGGSGADGLRSPESVIGTELGRIADAWHVAERHGLALAELLNAARNDLDARIRFRNRTEAALAGPRASAMVLAGLPLLGIGFGQLMGAVPLSVLFASPAGMLLLPLGTALVCAGMLWSDAITGKAAA